jgi:hypothetical protein
MTTLAEVRLVLRRLAELDLHGPQTIDETFVEQVRAAHAWATTRRCRWRLFRGTDLYGLRHLCEYDVGRSLSDKAFAVAADMAGWQPHRDWLRPEVLRFRRAQAEA